MAVTAKFEADFSRFHGAVDTATAKLRLFQGGTKDVQGSLNTMTTGLSTAGHTVAAQGQHWDKLHHNLTTFSSGARTIGFGLSAAITAPILAVGAAAVKLGIDAVESENLVSVSFGDMKSKAEEWSKHLSGELGLNQFELRKTAGVIFNMTTSM